MADKNIDKTFTELINDCQAIAVQAVKNAAKKTQNDILNEANSYLQKYYDNYNPKMYQRTYRLKRAILPYWSDKSSKNGVSIEVGVQYISSALKGAYKSNSKYHKSGEKWISRASEDFDLNNSDNGIPEPEWIMNNFLEGVHQWGDSEDTLVKDKDSSTNYLMEEFFDVKLDNHIEKYVQEELFNLIASKL